MNAQFVCCRRYRWKDGRLLVRAAYLAAIVALLATAPLTAAEYDFFQIVDTESVPPGGVSAVATISSAAFDGDEVVYHITRQDGHQGIFSWDGSTTTPLVDSTTVMPAGSGPFDAFRDVSLDNGNVAFFGSGADGLQGAYALTDGVLRRIVDTSMTMPESIATFAPEFFITASALDLALEGEHVAFSARGETPDGTAHGGIYVDTAGTLERVVDFGSEVPGFPIADFESFGNVDTDSGDVVFEASSGLFGSFGVYTTSQANGSTIRTVVDKNTVVPGLSNPLNEFAPNSVRLDEDVIVFAANSAGFFRNGLFMESELGISVVADEDTLDPRSGIPFTSLGGVFSHDAGTTTFWSVSSETPSGIFINEDGIVRDVIAGDSTIGGKEIAGVSLFQESQSGNNFVFHVDFVDGGEALYLAQFVDGIPGLDGDYNSNGLVDAPDAVLWRDTFGSGSDLRADGNANGIIDAPDYNVWRNNFGRTAMLSGDYNGNGEVDAPDASLWRDTFGSTTDLRADGNGNGLIDAPDYTIWRENFGTTNQTANIPEPAGTALVFWALTLLACRWRVVASR